MGPSGVEQGEGMPGEMGKASQVDSFVTGVWS